MARPKAIAPARRFHLSGQDVVTIDGKDFYLGKHDSAEAIVRYAVLIKAYQDNGLSLPSGFELPDGISLLDTQPANQADLPKLVRHVTAAYRERIKQRDAGNKADMNRRLKLCDEIDLHFGDMHADQFGPLALSQQRDRWVASGTKCRTYVNRLVRDILRMFESAVSRELIDASWSVTVQKALYF
jgi:hypothetical protein